MIDLEFLESLIRAVDASGIDSLEIERGGTRIRVAKTPQAPALTAGNAGSPGGWAQHAPAPAPGEAVVGGDPPPSGVREAGAEAGEERDGSGGEEERELVEVTSPMVGTFYRAPAPDAPPYVEVGDRIGEGQTLCIIEAMKLMNELESEAEGIVAEVCVENAEPVEYGQVLFRIEPS